MRADLHIHTYYSDGKQSPADVAEAAKNNGVDLIAVTDHDGVAGTDEALREAAARGIKAVRGIEVSAYLGDVKIHTLGYGCNADMPRFKEFLQKLNEGSLRRAEDVVCKLNKNGFKITMEEVLAERIYSQTPVHTMYIARACVRKGYGETEAQFYLDHLCYGKPNFSNVCRPNPFETCEVIKACGGFASIAHPGRVDMDAVELKKLIISMIPCGLCGIEAYYSTHTQEQTAYFIALAKEHNLEVTGGSDTHYPYGSRKIGTPYFEPSEKLLEIFGID